MQVSLYFFFLLLHNTIEARISERSHYYYYIDCEELHSVILHTIRYYCIHFTGIDTKGQYRLLLNSIEYAAPTCAHLWYLSLFLDVNYLVACTIYYITIGFNGTTALRHCGALKTANCRLTLLLIHFRFRSSFSHQHPAHFNGARKMRLEFSFTKIKTLM